MSTNYYIRIKFREKPVHIGKSSEGWTFALHYIPGFCEDLDQWKDYLYDRENVIFNQYQQKVELADLMEIITNRGKKNQSLNYIGSSDYMTETEIQDFEKNHHAVYDSSIGLFRHKDFDTVSRPPNETYDMIEGDFC